MAEKENSENIFSQIVTVLQEELTRYYNMKVLYEYGLEEGRKLFERFKEGNIKKFNGKYNLTRRDVEFLLVHIKLDKIPHIWKEIPSVETFYE